MNEHELRRMRETLDRCKTEAQHETTEREQEAGRVVWLSDRSGKGVIAEARRYFATGDADKIGAGLYDFSMQSLGEIAYYNLDGFRHEYHDVRDYLAMLGREAAGRARFMERQVYVYKDGLTSREVLDEVLRLADAERERIFSQGAENDRAEALAQATRLAESLGMKVVPA